MASCELTICGKALISTRAMMVISSTLQRLAMPCVASIARATTWRRAGCLVKSRLRQGLPYEVLGECCSAFAHPSLHIKADAWTTPFAPLERDDRDLVHGPSKGRGAHPLSGQAEKSASQSHFVWEVPPRPCSGRSRYYGTSHLWVPELSQDELTGTKNAPAVR